MEKVNNSHIYSSIYAVSIKIQDPSMPFIFTIKSVVWMIGLFAQLHGIEVIVMYIQREKKQYVTIHGENCNTHIGTFLCAKNKLQFSP